MVEHNIIIFGLGASMIIWYNKQTVLASRNKSQKIRKTIEGICVKYSPL